jgi:hypothetical protein
MVNVMCESNSSFNQTLRVTPAMEAGGTDQLWELEDIIGLL